ncbi:peptidyl-prolyl cis-trans isomerase B (cyclophilin B) [Paramicrobacterium humi]|uniref:peptidylprolyl isomerase n=1 Tax=Paramicrobacterium humi TaxID=640635 RepID=A0A1H4QQZ9_9MICO|nr:peptidylprolyl isomerase [Microbacterium humi]SEC21968.1 peptidyl-prolyl cis-trans isomerase B (cyclophilin B) [Microbacterium humi]
MARSKNDGRKSREERQRLRAYQARMALHDRRLKRRVRDNWIAGVLIVLVAVAAAFAQLFYFTGGPGAPEAEATPSPSASAQYSLPDSSLAESRDWTGTLTLNDDVELGITLDGAAAPQGVSNFVYLSQKGFYDGLSCHRLTTSENFGVLQCGDPNGDGSGGPGYSWGPVENAPSDNFYPAGTIAMARQSDKGDSMGSQFFIVYEDSTIPSDTAGGYTVLGTVTSGLDELTKQIADAGTKDGSADGSPAVPTTITGVTVQ